MQEEFDPRVKLPDGTPGYAINSGGMIDLMVRATSVAAFEAAAVEENLMRTVTDEDGTEIVTSVEHVHISGPMYPEVTPAEWETDLISGEQVVMTPAVLDTRPHYNVRLGAPVATRTLSDGETPVWMPTLIKWMQQGDVDENSNKNETGQLFANVTLIDPLSVSSPDRVWL